MSKNLDEEGLIFLLFAVKMGKKGRTQLQNLVRTFRHHHPSCSIAGYVCPSPNWEAALPQQWCRHRSSWYTAQMCNRELVGKMELDTWQPDKPLGHSQCSPLPLVFSENCTHATGSRVQRGGSGCKAVHRLQTMEQRFLQDPFQPRPLCGSMNFTVGKKTNQKPNVEATWRFRWVYFHAEQKNPTLSVTILIWVWSGIWSETFKLKYPPYIYWSWRLTCPTAAGCTYSPEWLSSKWKE